MPSHGPGICRKPGSLVTEVRPLTREDLEEILIPRHAPVVQRLRDPHHMVARLLAAGIRPMEEVARRTGYTVARIYTLNTDPAFKELVASYRPDVDAAFIASQDEFYSLATKNMVMAERMLSEKLEEHEEEGTLPPVRDLLAISRDAADRFGYGKKTTNLNVNVDFAAKLEKAIARSGVKTIEHEPRGGVSIGVVGVQATFDPQARHHEIISPVGPAGASLPLIRRRA